ncbi:unnamed protein product [Merluccius merluccius]
MNDNNTAKANLCPGSIRKKNDDQVLNITPKTQAEVDILKDVSSKYETVLWQPASPELIQEEAEVHLFVPANSSQAVQALLGTHDMTHTVLLTNTKDLLELQTRNDSTDPRSGPSYYEKYHSLEDIYHWLNKTAYENPDRVKVILIGSSFEKRPLYVVKLSVDSNPNKTAIWLDCGIHAREWISQAFCLWFVQYSLSYYQQNRDITRILDTMDVYVLPVMNPDGYKYTWTTDRFWRKNRSVREDSRCFGADLNRNFDASWCTAGASHDPCSEIYCGEFPESEPESRAVASFLRKHKEVVKLYVSIHSYSQMLLFPYSYTRERTENHDDLLAMVKEAAHSIKRYYKNSYKYGTGAQTIYLAPGGSDDWAYNLGIKYSFTFELQDKGRYGFLLPPYQIPKACNEALLAFKSIAINVIEKTQAPA